MPKYELMYLVSSLIPDPNVPDVYKQIRELVEGLGGTVTSEEFLEKKKLAYPIGRTKNGFYAVVVFETEPQNIAKIDAKIRTLKHTVIRHLIVNIEEHLRRKVKDDAKAAVMSAKAKLAAESGRGPKAATSGIDEKAVQENQETVQVVEAIEEEQAAPAPKAKRTSKKPAIEIDSEDLDSRIEAALSDEVV